MILASVVLLSMLPVLSGPDEVYAIQGARILTVSKGVIPDGTLILKNGVIEAVGASLPLPSGARPIDGHGLTLTPGLIDGFSGLGLPQSKPGSRPAGAEPPNPLSPQTLALDAIRVSDALKARDSGVTTALVISKDGFLPGQSVLVDLWGETPEALVLRQPAGLHLHMAGLPRRYPGSLMGTVAYARQALYDASRYQKEWTAYEKAPLGHPRPAYSAALEAWQGVLRQSIPLVVTAFRPNDIRRALAIADEFHVRLVVAGAEHAHRVATLVKERHVPLLVSVNFDLPRPATALDEDEDKEKAEIEDAERNPAELSKAGVPFALVSGHAADFLGGVRKAIDRGLPPQAALESLTLQAAKALSIADRTGSLEAGKIANVVAWSGEPLTKDAKVKMVFIDGHLYEPEAKPKKEEGDAPKEAGR